MRKFSIPRRWGIATACVIGMLLSASAMSQANPPANSKASVPNGGIEAAKGAHLDVDLSQFTVPLTD